MTFEDAILIIRKNYPNRLIWTGFEYKDLFIFAVAIDNKFVPQDVALAFVSVNKNTKETGSYPFWKNVLKDQELASAGKAGRLVDVTEEQAKMRQK